MRHFIQELQQQARKGPFGIWKTPPTGLFCTSGPVAHAEDDEDDEYDDPDNALSCGHMQKESSNGILPHVEKLPFIKTRKNHVVCCEKSLSSNDAGPECFYSDHPNKYGRGDACIYVGDWGFKKGTVRAKVYWPSGSIYEGELVGGNLHGVGTFRGADGTAYKGNWILNKKHRFGRKRYCNGDVYEGTWKRDVPEGQGCYFWKNGSEYYGGWRRGVLVWSSGDTYDGHWLDGLAEGCGVYSWEDGSAYVGTWRKGLKHGKGRFYPSGSKHVETECLHHAYFLSLEGDAMQDGCESIQSRCRQKICSPSYLPQELRRLCQASPFSELPPESFAPPMEDEESNLLLETPWSLESCERCALGHMYACQGWLQEASVSQRPALPLWEGDDEYSWQLREKKRFGEPIYKGHRSHDLMLNLQLGIRFSVAKVTLEKKRKLLLADFGPKSSLKVSFPRDGSPNTPPHRSLDFKWKDYCPMVFRYLREIFKIDAADYVLCMGGNAGLREVSSPGKSGSVFYLSQDERFMIKTLRKAEVKVLLKMLPKYYNHVRMHKNTLLTRFLGLHRIKPASGQKVRFIVMGNVVSTEARIHRRFDLKGSSFGRFTERRETNENITLKDLDLDLVFQLDPSWRDLS